MSLTLVLILTVAGLLLAIGSVALACKVSAPPKSAGGGFGEAGGLAFVIAMTLMLMVGNAMHGH